MQLHRISSVRRGNWVVEERDLLGSLVDNAPVGERDVSEAQISQPRTAGGRQVKRLPATAAITAIQSRKHSGVGYPASVATGELAYAKRVQLMPRSKPKDLISLSKPPGTLTQALLLKGRILQAPPILTSAQNLI